MKPTKPFDPKDLLAETCEDPEWTNPDGLPLWIEGVILVVLLALLAAVLYVAEVWPR